MLDENKQSETHTQRHFYFCRLAYNAFAITNFWIFDVNIIPMSCVLDDKSSMTDYRPWFVCAFCYVHQRFVFGLFFFFVFLEHFSLINQYAPICVQYLLAYHMLYTHIQVNCTLKTRKNIAALQHGRKESNHCRRKKKYVSMKNRCKCTRFFFVFIFSSLSPP